MSGRKTSALVALGRVSHLHPAQHADIITELDREGLLDGSKSNGGPVRAAASALPERTCLTVIQAAAIPGNAIRVKRVCAEARRLGFEIKANEVIDLFKLDQALAGKDVAARMNLKRNLAFLSLIS